MFAFSLNSLYVFCTLSFSNKLTGPIGSYQASIKDRKIRRKKKQQKWTKMDEHGQIWTASPFIVH